MKRILITGGSSFIGSHVKAYLKQWPESYQVEAISLRGEDWRQCSFAGFDAILHAAGIVHQPQSKDDPSQAELYDRVNHRLTVEVAQKAKEEGVGQFLFLSTEAVYGLHAPVGKVVTITPQSAPLTITASARPGRRKGLPPSGTDTLRWSFSAHP